MGIIFGKVDSAQPDFAVVQRHAAYEIRRYVPYAVAEVSGQAASQRKFGSQQFRVLAGYIGVFGTAKNTKKESMAMTAPVLSSMGGKGEKMDMTAPVLSSMDDKGLYSIGFVLPAQYSADNAPTPNDPRVSLRQVPARWVAVHTFPGEIDDRGVMDKVQWMLEEVLQDGYSMHPAPQGTHKTGWELARYNPPFTISMFKKNEIQVHLDDKSGEAPAS
eukprot:CAMPEP_0180136146 /NCGR_PEP_ID=MMETSP0986-20121125/11307_1 /TAXON_ID=697907 /ORGANISM="non described non described, Strain CCMP2293" /LENGTH=216 /DNA_ID=CAMNT_0022077089 /DNA_START=34 /DNA_END=684 /DNA_ORIENTATION=-